MSIEQAARRRAEPRRRTTGRRRAPGVLVAVGALVLGLIGIGQVAIAAPAVSAGTTQTISWVGCGNGFQCATVRVPLDYDQPAGTQISLAVSRLPATDQAHRRGSLFLNPGGPGSGAYRSGSDLPTAVRQRFDIIGMDPRGIGASTGLQCFSDAQQAMAATHRSEFPVTAEDRAEWKRVDQLFAAGCRANAGRIIDHMASADVARDLDLLRRLVGDQRLNYVGFSYGSILGQTYANMFPDRVGALVIDGVLDPVAWSTGQARQALTIPFTDRIGSAAASQLALGSFLTLCDQAGPGCAFSGDARARFDALAAAVRTKPVPYPGVPGSVVDYAALIRLMQNGLTQPQAWVGLAEDLADLASASGLSTPTAHPVVRGVARNAGALVTTTYPQFEGYQGVICTDTINPTHYEQWGRAADRATAQFPDFGAYWNWPSSICSIWPGQDDDRYLGPWNRTTANPVLVVGNYYDPATPYAGAQAAARLLPNSRLLSYAGWGHRPSLTSGNACITDAMVRYLVAGTLPPAGTVCQPTASPFD